MIAPGKDRKAIFSRVFPKKYAKGFFRIALLVLPISLIFLYDTIEQIIPIDSLRVRTVGNRVERFRLRNTREGEFTEVSFLGKRTFVFFGYVGCGTLCPTTLIKMRHISQILRRDSIHGHQGNGKPDDSGLQFLFVALEPISDDPQGLRAKIVPYGGFLTGLYARDLPSLKEAVAPFHLNVDLENPDIEEHSGFLYFVDERGVIRAIYTDSSMTAKEIAVDFLNRTEGHRIPDLSSGRLTP